MVTAILPRYAPILVGSESAVRSIVVVPKSVPANIIIPPIIP